MLKYIGDGRHITGIPATDLDDTQISDLAEIFNLTPTSFEDLLIERGLYARPSQPKKAASKKQDTESKDG